MLRQVLYSLKISLWGWNLTRAGVHPTCVGLARADSEVSSPQTHAVLCSQGYHWALETSHAISHRANEAWPLDIWLPPWLVKHQFSSCLRGISPFCVIYVVFNTRRLFFPVAFCSVGTLSSSLFPIPCLLCNS